MKLEPTKDGFTIDAADLGTLLGMPSEVVRRMMREGSITTRFERGIDEDSGRYRLTFTSRERRVQLIVDEAGDVLHRSRVSHPPPPDAEG